MKWYKLAYTDDMGNDNAHFFSGNTGTVRMVMAAYHIDLDSVSSFTVDEEDVDLRTYIGGDE